MARARREPGLERSFSLVGATTKYRRQVFLFYAMILYSELTCDKINIVVVRRCSLVNLSVATVEG